VIAVPLTQNTPQWQQFRHHHFGASEAPAMLGVCPYKTREQLLTEKKTGEIKPVDHYTQRRFDEGHRCERLARPLAEKALKDELFPCVGTLENSRLSASFDGLTLDNAIVWEHKILNKTLRELFKENAALPLHYRVQLEQQLLVSGAEKALFMATSWDESAQQIMVANEIIAKRWSVRDAEKQVYRVARETEEMALGHGQNDGLKTGKAHLAPSGDTLRLERALADLLGTKVSLKTHPRKDGRGGGQLVIDFHDWDHLNALLERQGLSSALE